MNERVQAAINDQINAELYSAYIYLAMAAQFEAMNLQGFAHWMRHQAEEEREHAMRLFNHLVRRGARVVLKGIAEPPLEFGTPLETFQKALAHEEHITKRIHDLYALAQEVGDYPAQLELHWFIDEQVEEEENTGRVVELLKLAGDNAGALLLLDRELAKRSDEDH